MEKKYFFCGIGGSGMSALASALKLKGVTIFGSDRSFDKGLNLETKLTLERLGINIRPQDGSGLDKNFDALVVSSAVETSIPDVKKAIDLNLKIIKRAELLAEVFNQNAGIAIGGTSGKTTVTGMTGHILKQIGFNPFVINGGIMSGVLEGLGNAISGSGKMVIEADESDGSISLYNPQVAVITNITLDHKPIEELQRLFADFIARASVGAVLNADCEKTIALKKHAKKILSYSITNSQADIFADNIHLQPFGSSFEVMGNKVELQVAGSHNVSNALAAIAASIMLGANPQEAIKAVASFGGIKRRLEVIGKVGAITIIDDFAHNPDKINASMTALKKMGKTLKVFFQMHGFAPTKMFGKEIADVFAKHLQDGDIIAIPEIYYAGGTVDKTISAKSIVDEIKTLKKDAHFFENREMAKVFLLNNINQDDVLVIMGARDDTLSDLAREMFLAIQKREN